MRGLGSQSSTSLAIRPCGSVFLAAPPKRAPPEVVTWWRNAECRDCWSARRDRRSSPDDLPQPLPLFGDRLMHAPPQLLLDFLAASPACGRAGSSAGAGTGPGEICRR